MAAAIGLVTVVPVAVMSSVYSIKRQRPIPQTSRVMPMAAPNLVAGSISRRAEQCPVLNPNSAASWNASGVVRMYLGGPAKSIEHFERGMRLSPLDQLTYFAFTGMALAHVFAGHYDEALSCATKALHEQPNLATALRVAAIANVLSDRMVEARAAMARLREVDPALTLSNLDRVAPPFRRPEDRERYTESLRKAGLPE